LIIGDTEADIIAGKQLGLRTFAVTSGIRNAAFLKAIEPDYVIDRVGMVVDRVLSSDKK
jgi:phosphoglycolate phosphatase-like HAD superfamily hydrolase